MDRFCPPLSDVYRLCRDLPGRNSKNGYPQFLPEINGTFEGYAIDFAFSVIEAFDPLPPRECIMAAQHILCVAATPPCDPKTGLLMSVCRDSCLAYDYLLSTNSCMAITEHARTLKQETQYRDLSILLDKYLNVNCSDPSTVYFTLNDSSEIHPEKCTDLFDTQTLGECIVTFEWSSINNLLYNTITIV